MHKSYFCCIIFGTSTARRRGTTKWRLSTVTKPRQLEHQYHVSTPLFFLVNNLRFCRCVERCYKIRNHSRLEFQPPFRGVLQYFACYVAKKYDTQVNRFGCCTFHSEVRAAASDSSWRDTGVITMTSFTGTSPSESMIHDRLSPSNTNSFPLIHTPEQKKKSQLPWSA